MQTLRIPLAISSLQLFIQRGLLNLEPKVHSFIINAKQWDKLDDQPRHAQW